MLKNKIKNKIIKTCATALTVIITFALLNISVLAQPQPSAFATSSVKAYSWKTNIDAQINTDGSIQVSEQKIIDVTPFIEKAKKYDEKKNNSKIDSQTNNQQVTELSPLTWSYGSFSEKAYIEMSDAKIALIGQNDAVIGNWSKIESGTFYAKWHNSGGPISSMYAVDEEYKEICLYTELVNADQVSHKKAYEIVTNMCGTNDKNLWNTNKAIINLNYTINNAPVVYKDVSDFSWNYVSSTWEQDSYDVDLKITIPIGSQSIASPLGKINSNSESNNNQTERNIYAWGHGSSNGIVNLDSNGTVTVTNDVVPKKTDASLRVVFPSAWLSNLDQGCDISHSNQVKLGSILREESVWKDSKISVVNKYVVILIFLTLYIFSCIVVLWASFFFKKKFNNTLIDSSKLKNINPAILVRLKNWNHEHANDIVASILNMNDKKIVKIKRLASSDFKIILKDNYFLENTYKTKIDLIDKWTIDFLFKTCACNSRCVRISDILNFANSRSFEFRSAYLTWHSLLTDCINSLSDFKCKYDKVRHIFFWIAGIIVVLSLIAAYLFTSWIILICGLLCAFAVAGVANSMRNKILFVDKEGRSIDSSELKIGLEYYTKKMDQFKHLMSKTLTEANLISQDKTNINL